MLLSLNLKKNKLEMRNHLDTRMQLNNMRKQKMNLSRNSNSFDVTVILISLLSCTFFCQLWLQPLCSFQPGLYL